MMSVFFELCAICGRFIFFLSFDDHTCAEIVNKDFGEYMLILKEEREAKNLKVGQILFSDTFPC